MKVKEVMKDNSQLLVRLKEQADLNTELQIKVKADQIENHSLVACIDEMRKQILEFKKPEVKSQKFQVFENMLKKYESAPGV